MCIASLYLYHALPPFICTRSGGCSWQVLSLLNWLKYITGEILYGWCEVLAKDFLSFQMCTFIFFSCPVGWLFIGSDDSQLFWSQSLNNFWLWHLKHLWKMSPSFLTCTSFFVYPVGWLLMARFWQWWTVPKVDMGTLLSSGLGCLYSRHAQNGVDATAIWADLNLFKFSAGKCCFMFQKSLRLVRMKSLVISVKTRWIKLKLDESKLVAMFNSSPVSCCIVNVSRAWLNELLMERYNWSV